MTDQERLLTDIIAEHARKLQVYFGSQFTGDEYSSVSRQLVPVAFEAGKKEGMRELAEWINAHIGLWDKKWQAKLKELEKGV